MTIVNQQNPEYQELIHQVGRDLETGLQQFVTVIKNAMVTKDKISFIENNL